MSSNRDVVKAAITASSGGLKFASVQLRVDKEMTELHQQKWGCSREMKSFQRDATVVLKRRAKKQVRKAKLAERQKAKRAQRAEKKKAQGALRKAKAKDKTQAEALRRK